MKTRARSFHASDEGGWALVTAVSLMAIMLVIGFGTLSTVDFNSSQTRQQRERESSLNLAEGVLYAQAFALARMWPSPGKAAHPPCSSNLATSGACPNRENLSAANAAAANKAGAAFNSTDFLADGSWTTRVRDNYGGLASSYSPTVADGNLTGSLGLCAAPCSRDFNDDKALWVESRTVVRGEPRKIVALMKLELIQEGVPRTGLTSGAISMTNNGKGGASYDSTGAPVVVRCAPDSHRGNNATCTNYGSNNTVTPPPVRGTVGNLMTLEQIERFRERAKIDGTWTQGCPTTLAGAVVFAERCARQGLDPGQSYQAPAGSNCSPVPNGMSTQCWNSIQKPGLLIIRCGGIQVRGGTYVGVMYFVNGSDGSCTTSGGAVRGTVPPAEAQCPRNGQRDPSLVVLDVQDGGGVWGAVAADGNACVQFGSNGHQFDFDPNVFSNISSYGTVGLVQNTWRELPPGAN